MEKQIGLFFGISLFIGLALVASGFTGMYSLDFEQSLCGSDEECSSGEVCCYFYRENNGVCDKESKCDAIYQLTKEEKEARSDDVFLGKGENNWYYQNFERPQNIREFYSFIAVGIFLVAIAVLGFIYRKRK